MPYVTISGGNIVQSLINYFAERNLEDKRTCSKCKTAREVTERIIIQTPEVLRIQTNVIND